MLSSPFVPSTPKKRWRNRFRTPKTPKRPDSADPLVMVSTFPAINDSPTDSDFSGSFTSSESVDWSSPRSLFGTPSGFPQTPASVQDLPSRKTSWTGSSLLSPSRIRSHRKCALDSISSLAVPEPFPPAALTGPTIKPFIFTHTPHTPHHPELPTPPVTRSTAQDKCFVCEELLVNKLESETLLPLQCGDFLHWECFKLSVEYEIEKISAPQIPHTNEHMLAHIFFKCQGNVCASQGVSPEAVPKDMSLLEELLAKMPAISHYSSGEAGAKLGAFAPLLCASEPKTPPRALTVPDIFDNSSPPSERHDGGRVPRKERRISSFASSNLDVSSVALTYASRSPSPAATISTLSTVTVKIDAHKNLSSDNLKSNLIKYLIHNCSSLNLNSLLSFGKLRLADRLFASLDGENYQTKLVYLFETQIVMWDENADDQVVQCDIRKSRMTTPSASIIKISIKINGTPASVWLNSETPSIIEKWVVAGCDYDFCFPVEIVTSTILMPEFPTKNRSSVSLRSIPFSPTLSPQVESPNSTGNTSDSTIDLKITDFDEESKVEAILMESASISEDTDDSDSDGEFISRVLDEVQDTTILVSKSKIDDLFRNQSTSIFNSDAEPSERESDSDEDSDAGKISELIKKDPVLASKNSVNTEWNALISNIDSAITMISF